MLLFLVLSVLLTVSVNAQIVMPPFVIPEYGKTYETINTTQPALIEVEIPEISVRSIEINVKRNVSGVAINITRISRKPPDIIQNLTGPVYQYINITHENITDQDVENITISFDVNQSWVAQNNVNKSRVFLSRYTTQWDRLPTRLVNETAERIYYVAVSPGLSIIAIFGEYFAHMANQTCIPMDRRCYGNILQECNYYGTEWVAKEVCQYGCFDIGCSAEPGSPEADWWLVITVIVLIILILSGLLYYFEGKRKRKTKELAVSERLR